MVKYKKKSYFLEFIVVKSDAKPILGIKACEQMGLIKRVMTLNKSDEKNIFKEYADMFEGIGCLEGEHSIRIDESVTPKVHPPRKIPVTLREKLRNEQDGKNQSDCKNRRACTVGKPNCDCGKV